MWTIVQYNGRRSLRLSYPVTNPADDGVQVLQFAFEEDDPGALFAVLTRVV